MTDRETVRETTNLKRITRLVRDLIDICLKDKTMDPAVAQLLPELRDVDGLIYALEGIKDQENIEKTSKKIAKALEKINEFIKENQAYLPEEIKNFLTKNTTSSN